VPGEQLPGIGGLAVWADKRNYLCLIVGYRGRRDVCFWGCLEGSDVVVGRGRLPSVRAAGRKAGGSAGRESGQGTDRAGIVYLRLERAGDRVRALCSADGAGWFAVGEVAYSVADPGEVGLVAIGSIDRAVYPGAHPEGTAIRFESFDLWGAHA
jgi:hypothetical protein